MENRSTKRRNTPVKQAILELLEQSEAALSQDMIEQRLPIAADRATIYRMLQRFCDDGLAHRAVSDEGKSYYALCRDCGQKHTHDHFHFRCLSCEKVECLHEPVELRLPRGYRAEQLNCWVSGYCRDCRRQG